MDDHVVDNEVEAEVSTTNAEAIEPIDEASINRDVDTIDEPTMNTDVYNTDAHKPAHELADELADELTDEPA